jgi:hypothetical protein
MTCSYMHLNLQRLFPLLRWRMGLARLSPGIHQIHTSSACDGKGLSFCTCDVLFNGCSCAALGQSELVVQASLQARWQPLKGEQIYL